ncbi:MAG: class 1 fructose-bisphosphatase [Planctomycetes bacterium]|nr:class 1 fructose-bisphosphatase [Planctomycetota bacterium]
MTTLLAHVPRVEGGNLPALLRTIADAGNRIARAVARAGIGGGGLGASGRVNIQGEACQKLDDTAQDIFAEVLSSSGLVAVMASEEVEQPTIPPDGARGAFAVSFDPLDGSSNIDTNISIGSIFSVLRRRAPAPDPQDLLRPGREQVAAGYLVYGPRTTLTYSAGKGVHTFTLDPDLDEWVLTHEDMKIPARGNTCSTNGGNSPWWFPGMLKFVEWAKTVDPASGRPYGSRYVGSLVADFHRTLLKGGIFLYPADTKDPKKPEGKLRLLYECSPIAYLAEQAGGAASTGKERILDIVPKAFHQRCPLAVGSREDVAQYDVFTNQLG